MLLPVFANPPHGVLFIERAQHLRRHAGQIGLPGGSADPVDRDEPERTALRELYEEVGIAAASVTIVGRLPELEQRLSRFVITTVVGVVAAGTRVVPDGDEVAGTFEVPLAAILAEQALYDDVETSSARNIPMYAFDYGGRHIWGFTARILRSFVDEWNSPASELRRTIAATLLS